MSKRNLFLLGILAFVVSMASSCSQTGLYSSNWEGFGPFTARTPYTSYVDYYGYVDSKVQPQGKYKGKDAYYLYLWVPAVIDEVGVSMKSPAPADEPPEEGAFKHPYFDTGVAADAEAYFDTYLALEKMDILEPEKIKDGGSVLGLLTTNDDNSDMGPNPGGSNYNSLLRHESEVSNPLKALTRGVYRIVFTSFRGNVKGSYVAQVGTNIPGSSIAATLEELHKAVNQ